MRVLIVEDEARLARLLALELEHAGFDTVTATTGREALDRSTQGDFDCMLLDVMLPDLSGFEVCRRTRQMGDMPIIIVSARGQVPDKVAGLELGADDYVVKPVNSEELAARIRAVARRRDLVNQPDLRRYRIGNVVLLPEQHQVLVDGQVVPFTPLEFRMLEHFLREINRVQSRNALLDAVWGVDFAGDTNLVEVTVGRLRRRLADAHSDATIETVRGVGYVLRSPPQ